MQPSDPVDDVIRYGLTVSALMFALVLWGFGRGGVGRGYNFMAVAGLMAAVRHFALLVLPASPMLLLATNIELVVRGAVLLFAAQLFARGKARLSLPLLMLAGVAALAGAYYLDGDERLLRLPGATLCGLGLIGCALHFFRERDPKQPVGFLGAGLSLMVMAGLWLGHPWLPHSPAQHWGMATLQVSYILASGFLVLALYFSQRLRADFASQLQERALIRVLRSRRRVVQLREWTDVLLQQMTDGVIVCDMSGRITGFNRAAEKIYGHRANDVLGESITMLVPAEKRPGDVAAFLSEVVAREDYLGTPREFFALHSDGHVLELEMVVSAMAMNDAEQMIAMIRDISERKQQQKQLDFMARHDGLTTLPNRHFFEEQVSRRLADGVIGTFVFVDLDDFKLINDTLGHKAGDTALVAMSRRLVSVAGDDAVVARQSGDEFVIFLPGKRDEARLREWVEDLVGRVRQPVTFDDVEFGLSCSVGVAPWIGDDSAEVETMVRRADLAMYHAKRSGKNRYSFFEDSMLTESSRTAELAAQLKRMEPERDLSIVLQPRMRLEGRLLSGAEVLVRWRMPNGEDVPPHRFIPVAEETGQILRIGYWVIEQSCQYLAQWGHLHEYLVLSINLSPRQLFDEELVDRIEAMRLNYGLAPAQLEFEITESSAMQDINYAIRVLSRLRALGYGLSLDDFGTGFSSLSHMRSLPVDTIKIDRSFIMGMSAGRQERVMVAGIVELASHLGMHVLAEGVETEEQLEILDSLGCDEAQGYFIGRPMPPEVFVDDVLNGWGQSSLNALHDG